MYRKAASQLVRHWIKIGNSGHGGDYNGRASLVVVKNVCVTTPRLTSSDGTSTAVRKHVSSV